MRGRSHPPETIIETLYEKTKFIIEEHITQRDVENFVVYLKYLSDSADRPKAVRKGNQVEGLSTIFKREIKQIRY